MTYGLRASGRILKFSGWLEAYGKGEPAKAAPLTDAGATSYHAVRRVLPKLRPGSTAVLVTGSVVTAGDAQLLLAPDRAVGRSVNAGYARRLTP